MGLDLEKMRADIQSHLQEGGFTVFYGFSRRIDSLTHVNWDTAQHPDFRDFLRVAREAGAKLIVFSHDSLGIDRIDEAIEDLEECDLSREEKRNYEKRLRDLQSYEGFTCSLELSFDLEGRVYLFEVQTEWFEELANIIAEIESSMPMEEDDEDAGPISGYFSNN